MTIAALDKYLQKTNMVEPKMTVDLTLVIPCFNEEDTILNTAETVLAYVAQHYSGLNTELILIDDGSSDGTTELLAALAQRYEQVQPIFFAANKGRGAAIKAGIQHSRGNFVILLDADLSYDVNHIGEILNAFEDNPKTDVVVVSPYMKGGVVKGVPFSRLMLSRMANWILAGFFLRHLSTVTCVVRGYRGDKIRQTPLFEEGKELHLEILRKLHINGAHMLEIPGRLVWKTTKQAPRRKNNLKVWGAAKKHLLYGFLIRPTRLFNAVVAALLLVGVYESLTIAYNVIQAYKPGPDWTVAIWHALSVAFTHSPHTFIIASVALVLGFQSLFYLAIVEVLKLQQEESMRHLMAILQKQSVPEQAS